MTDGRIVDVLRVYTSSGTIGANTDYSIPNTCKDVLVRVWKNNNNSHFVTFQLTKDLCDVGTIQTYRTGQYLNNLYNLGVSISVGNGKIKLIQVFEDGTDKISSYVMQVWTR